MPRNDTEQTDLVLKEHEREHLMFYGSLYCLFADQEHRYRIQVWYLTDSVLLLCWSGAQTQKPDSSLGDSSEKNWLDSHHTYSQELVEFWILIPFPDFHLHWLIAHKGVFGLGHQSKVLLVFMWVDFFSNTTCLVEESARVLDNWFASGTLLACLARMVRVGVILQKWVGSFQPRGPQIPTLCWSLPLLQNNLELD